MQICRGFTDEQWTRLRKRLLGNGGKIQNDEAAWRCAVEVFERRIRERFLSCIEALQDDDSRSDIEVPAQAPADCSTLPKDDGRRLVVPGFAIMALSCLLIEALQSFLEAPEKAPQTAGPCTYPMGPCIRPQPSTTEAFKKFLRLPAFKGAFDDEAIAREFVDGVRNGILHEAETRRWVIRRNKPRDQIIEREGDRYTLNRTVFYTALKAEFGNYVQQLRDPQNLKQRSRFIKKMDEIVKEC